jgi:hypothetical protein
MNLVTKPVLCLAVVLLLAGCAGTPSQEMADKNLAVRDFVELRQLEELPKLRSQYSKGWDEITRTYIIYKTRRANYLVEFARPCWQLADTSRIIADERFEPNVIRAKYETLRGCRIAAIYALDEAEVAELQNIGEPPGSRN